jgi:hypothetical protein
MLGPETGRVKEGCSVYIPISLNPIGDVLLIKTSLHSFHLKGPNILRPIAMHVQEAQLLDDSTTAVDVKHPNAGPGGQLPAQFLTGRHMSQE